ncbi:hypothetical protein NBRC10512_007578 [Rhodotorula toruloides]|uniref:F-box domain-containing protein n=1 Tax=Rhodotorula toruloides (strain NP11) TaxID=1130832 RepID=M7WHC1_RHOT1|nr:uncharacterized protein RHTO_03905 [Rhodotorula toruloides NP11]EMS19862.1 hypothetical protein RHTO_03905 [Rhodotorula toruloides NP11]
MYSFARIRRWESFGGRLASLTGGSLLWTSASLHSCVFFDHPRRTTQQRSAKAQPSPHLPSCPPPPRSLFPHVPTCSSSLPEGQEDGTTVGGLARDEEPNNEPVGLPSLPDELIARIYRSHIFVPNLNYPEINVAYQWRLTCINRRIYHLARPLAFNHLAINDADSWMPSLLVFLAAQAVPLPSTTSLLVQVETQTIPLVMVMAPRLLPNLTTLVLGIGSQGEDDRYVLPRYVTDVLPHFQQLQRLQVEDFESLEDEDFDICRLSSLKDLILKRGATTQLSFLRHGADLPLRYLELLPIAAEDIPIDLAIPWGHLRSLTLILYGASAAYTAILDKLKLHLTTHPDRQLPLHSLAINAPWQDLLASSVKPEHQDVAPFLAFLEAALRHSAIIRLKIDHLTIWPLRKPLLRYKALHRLRLDLCDPTPDDAKQRDRLPLTDIFYILLNFPCLQYLFLDATSLHDCLDGHHLLKQPTLANSPHLPIFEPTLSALVQSLQSTTVISFSFRPIEPFGLFTHRQLRWTRRSPQEPFVFSLWTLGC